MTKKQWSAAELVKATRGEWRNLPPADALFDLTTDSREVTSNTLFIPLVGERFNAHDFIPDVIAKGAPAVMVDRSYAGPCDVPTLVVDDTTKAFQSIAHFLRMQMPELTVIGITGSSGKTSTKDMLRTILSELVGADKVLATAGNFNNHIGVPMTLLNLLPTHDFAVVEMGTNHHGEIETLAQIAVPNAAILTCVGASHLEHFITQEEVAREKSHIFKALKGAKHATIPEYSIGQNFIDEACKKAMCRRFGPSLASPMQMTWISGDLTTSTFQLHSKVSGNTATVTWAIPGMHQAMNAAGVALLCESLGFPLEKIAVALSKTTLSGMRSLTREHDGVRWVNDAYNANPESMRAAILTLAASEKSSDLLLVLGDMRELGPNSVAMHEDVIRLVREKLPQARLILVGPDFQRAMMNLRTTGVDAFRSSRDAVDFVQKTARHFKTVFLKASRGTQIERVEPGFIENAH